MTEREKDALITSLYENYHTLVFNRIHQFIRDVQTCEELTQDTFIRAWQVLSSLNSARNIRGWLYIIASNKAKDYLRSSAHKRLQHTLSLENWFYGTVPDMQESYLTREHMQAAFNLLSRADKNMLFLYDVCGYSSDEIARAIGANRKRVLYLVDHARKSFRSTYMQAS